MELANAYRPVDGRADAFLRWLATQRVGDPTSARVRAMTIHQAKGLEFDAVILPELAGYWATGLAGFYADRDGSGVASGVFRYLNSDLRHAAPEFVHDAQRRYVDRQTIEQLCLLYVAMTRAIHGLYLIVPPPPKGEKEHAGSSADLLRMTLVAEQDESPDSESDAETPELAPRSIFRLGDPEWTRRVQPRATGEVGEREERSPANARPTIVARPEGRHRMRARRRPSGPTFDRFHGGEPVVSFDGRERGRFLHACLESVEWTPPHGAFSDGDLDAIVVRALRRLRWPTLPETCRRDDLVRYLASPQARRLLRRDEYLAYVADRHAGNATFAQACRLADRLEAENERPVAASGQGETILGRVDRIVWFLGGNRPLAAEIIDWKTDAAPDVRREEALAQLADYREAIVRSSRLPLAAVVAAVVFVATGEIATLDD